MQNNKGSIFTPKFKKYFFITTITISIITSLFINIFSLSGNNIFNKYEVLFSVITGLYLIFVLVGMFVDESVRKYPGLIVLGGTSIYMFSYMSICIAKGGYNVIGLIILSIYLLLVFLLFLAYKYVYPKIVSNEKIHKIFNTLFLGSTSLLTIILGTICSL